MDEEILQNLNQSLDEALEKGRQAVNDEQFAKRLDDLKKQAETTIRHHPLKSIAAGLLAGYVLGKIFSSDD